MAEDLVVDGDVRIRPIIDTDALCRICHIIRVVDKVAFRENLVLLHLASCHHIVTYDLKGYSTLEVNRTGEGEFQVTEK